MAERDWLQKLQPGDEVAISQGSWATWYTFEKVERLTATLILVGRKRFRRRDGWEAGVSSRHAAVLKEATAELKAEVAREKRRRELLARVSDVRWRDLPDEQLEQIVAVLDAANGTE